MGSSRRCSLSSPLLSAPLPSLHPAIPPILPLSLSVCGFVLNCEESDRNLSSSGFLSSSLLLYLPFSSGSDHELSGLAAFSPPPLSAFRIPVAPQLTRGPKGGECGRLICQCNTTARLLLCHQPVNDGRRRFTSQNGIFSIQIERRK